MIQIMLWGLRADGNFKVSDLEVVLPIILVDIVCWHHRVAGYPSRRSDDDYSKRTPLYRIRLYISAPLRVF